MQQELALVYEQNAELAQQVRKVIQRVDYRVRTTSDERRFWETYSEEGADLVDVDLRTPGAWKSARTFYGA